MTSGRCRAKLINGPLRGGGAERARELASAVARQRAKRCGKVPKPGGLGVPPGGGRTGGGSVSATRASLRAGLSCGEMALMSLG